MSTLKSKIERKKDARLWILAAIRMRHDKIYDKAVEAEVKRFIRRIQRDIDSLNLALGQLHKSRKDEIARLIKSQARDDKERNLRFENAIRK